MAEFACPECGAECITFPQGCIRCGQCGLQEAMPYGLRLRPNYPRRWLVEDYIAPDPTVTGFEDSPRKVV